MSLTLSEISLYAATREQAVASWKRTAVEWATGLTLEEYIDRELVGEKREFARDGKNITWVLAPRNDPTTLDFLCSCETFKREIVISRPSDPSPIIGYGYGIGSVFTPVINRGKGYAKHMMRLLHWVLASEAYLSTQVYPEVEWGPRPLRVANAGDGIVAVLWSDVGPTFYKSCGMGASDRGDGWEVRDPVSTIWDVRNLEDMGDLNDQGAVWFNGQKGKEVWEEDGRVIKTEVEQASKETGYTQFSFLPGKEVAWFHWFRQHYYFSRYVVNAPEYCGVQTNRGEAFASWTCEFRPGSHKTLIITRLRANKETVEDLMRLVLKYAKDHGLEAVETWNLPENLTLALSKLRGRRVERDEHYPAMKWYKEEERVEWMMNERFCWC